MNSFLGNLINRHQEFNEQHEGYGAAYKKVEPRPKARFESEAFTTPNATNDQSGEQGIVQGSQSASDPRSFSAQHRSHAMERQAENKNTSSTVRSPLETPNIPGRKSANADQTPQLDVIHERLNALAVSMGETQHVQEEDARSSGNQQFRQGTALSHLAEDKKGSSTTTLSIESDMNSRIQEILQRLDDQQTGLPNSPNAGNVTGKTDSTGLRHEAKVVHTHTALQPQFVPTTARQSTVAPLPADNRKPDAPLASKPGLLQMPIWLAQMQADLNQRWQALNEKAETEQVVNVTIGRVEVRAIKPETAGRAKSQTKPRGVMSLDDYLKQRERGRQA